MKHLKNSWDGRSSLRENIDWALEQLDKHVDPNSALFGAVCWVIDGARKLLEENAALKESLFNLEQAEPIRWETILAEKLERAIRENNKKDYLEVVNSINNDIFVITIQRKFGQTPEQLQKQSDIRRLKAAKKIVNLLSANKEMAEKLAKQAKDIQLLTALRMPNLEEELKTRDDVQRAIDQLNIIIKNYNKHTFARQMGKLTTSMQQAYRESWMRAAMQSSENLKLTKDIKLLKQELNQKRIVHSKFSKYRKGGIK